jgi:hypothetical protein
MSFVRDRIDRDADDGQFVERNTFFSSV